MIAFLAGWGLFDLILLGIFIIAMTGGCIADRMYHRDSPKWWILGIGLVIVIGLNYKHVSLLGLIFSWTLWWPIIQYLICGVIYSIIEYIFEIKVRAPSYFEDSWNAFLLVEAPYGGSFAGVREGIDRATGSKLTNRDILHQATSENASVAIEIGKSLISSYVRSQRGDKIVEASISSTGLSVEPSINKKELADTLSAWTILWPFYALSWVLGDLLTHVFRLIANTFVRFSQKMLQSAFSDTFKV
jgi:hypothetical protein